MVRLVTPCPIAFVFTLAVLCSSAQGCKATRTPIFDWADPPPVAGVSTAGQAGSTGSAPVQGGRSGSEVAGQPGEMPGESGSGGDAQVDPNARFEWKQMLPDTTCAQANFVGTFSCNVQNSLTNQRIDGTLFIDLVGPSEDQTLKAAENSSLNLLTDPANNLSLMTKVTGTADCKTLLFRGDVPATAFTFDQVGIPFQLALGGFCGSGLTGGSVSGTLLGQLDTGGITGQMALTIGTCACEGAFNLRAQR